MFVVYLVTSVVMIGSRFVYRLIWPDGTAQVEPLPPQHGNMENVTLNDDDVTTVSTLSLGDFLQMVADYVDIIFQGSLSGTENNQMWNETAVPVVVQVAQGVPQDGEDTISSISAGSI